MSETTGTNPKTAMCIDEGVDVVAEPWYMEEESDPDQRRYVFGYKITIRNRGTRWAKLMSRRWLVIDANGERNIVEGDGVVGRQPELHPGEIFEYASYCPIKTPWGTMEGAYVMKRDDGESFAVEIPRFYLAMPR